MGAIREAWAIEKKKLEPNLMAVFFWTFWKQSLCGATAQVTFLVTDVVGPAGMTYPTDLPLPYWWRRNLGCTNKVLHVQPLTV